MCASARQDRGFIVGLDAGLLQDARREVLVARREEKVCPSYPGGHTYYEASAESVCLPKYFIRNFEIFMGAT